MPAPVRVLFAADGAQAVSAVFKSLKKEAQELAKTQVRSAKVASREATKAANDTAKADVAAAKAAERVDANKARIREKSATMAGRIAKRQADAEIREAQRAAKQLERIRENSATLAGRIAEKQAKQEALAAQKAQATTANRNRGLARGASQMTSRAVRGTIGTVTGVAGTLGLAGGGMMIGNALMGGIELQRQAALLSNATNMPGAPGKSPQELMAMATGTATKTGFKAEDVMSAMNIVSARAGGAPGINAMAGDLDDIAKTAMASGVAMEDMGAVYAAALNAGVKPGEEMRKLMVDFVDMGKKGAVEFSDLAGELAKLGGAGRAFGSGAGMLRQVVGLAQLAVQTDVSPEEARTTIIDMVREFTQGPKMARLKKAGVDVTNAKTGKLNDPAELLASTIAAANTVGIGGEKGLAGLSSIFSGKSAGLARLLNETYLAAEGKTKGSGKQAILDQIAGASATSMTMAQRDKEYGVVSSTPAQQAARAMEEFNAKIREMIPEVTKLLPAALDAVKGLAELAKFAANNPFKALGGIFAAHLAGELATAGIARIVESGFRRILGGIPTGGGGGGLPGGGMGKVGTGLAIAGTAVAFTAALSEATNASVGEGADAGKQVLDAKYRGLEFASYYRNKAGKEGLTDEERAGLVKQAKVMEGWGATARSHEEISGWDTINPDAYATRAGYRAGGGDYAKPEAFAEVAAAMKEIAASAKSASAELNKVQGNSIASPGNPARTSPASSMSTGK